MQEIFTKDLQELKNKQTEKNNTLEGNHSRIIEAEEWINDLEDRMLEITATEQDVEKRMKKMKTTQETSGTTLNSKPLHYRGTRRKEKERT